MARSAVALVVFACVLTVSAQSNKTTAQPKPRGESRPSSDGSAAVKLPVKRVVLYKNGVGYFEHSARVRDNQDLSIDFTTSQLNDVIKSLTVLDLGEGKISSVRYNSVAPVTERLKALRLPLTQQVTRVEFLRALRGARVDVRSGPSAASGKLLSVEQRSKRTDKGETTETVEFSIVTDGGDLRSFELTPATTVRVADRDLNEEVGRYLNLVGSARATDLRRMTISTVGSGARDVFVSYISEVPVWKSTYRIVLPAKPAAAALLQGWAIVDNTVGEDWTDVQLSLVAGSPQSFVQDISQPFYVRRPVIALPESVTLTPQTHEGTLMNLPLQAPVNAAGGPTTMLEGTVKDPTGAVIPGARVTLRNEETGVSQSTTADSSGHYRFMNVPAGNSAVRVSSPGFKDFLLSNLYLGVGRNNQIDATLQVGAANETVEVTAGVPTLNTETSSLAGNVGIARAMKTEPVAEGKDLGTLFSYDIKQKITIGKNQSALVPILQGRIDAEKVTLWTDAPDADEDSPNTALRALWITNNTGLTLDSGTFNILEADTFAGEGLLDSLRPAEKRLISYAADPAVRVRAEQEASAKPFSRVLVAKGVMKLTREERESVKYVIRNSDTTPRQVIIEHPAREQWKLVDGTKSEESSASFHRFRVPVEPGKTAELVLQEYRPVETALALTDLTSDQVTLISQQATITPALQDAFRRILEQKLEISRLENELEKRKQELAMIEKDQARLRENMKALKGSSEEKSLLQRYTRQLDSQEDRLAVLRKESADLESRQEKAESELGQMVLQISMDEKLGGS